MDEPENLTKPDIATGLRGMAVKLEADIAELELRKAAARTRAGRKPINRRIRMPREMVHWCQTRAGY
jgi:hypothetical protein